MKLLRRLLRTDAPPAHVGAPGVVASPLQSGAAIPEPTIEVPASEAGLPEALAPGVPSAAAVVDIAAFAHVGGPPEGTDLSRPLQALFWNNEGRVIHKWHHYLDIYDRHFAPFRGTAPTVLEIGVQNGGSLQMWRDYFGADARLFGIDIDPTCASLDGDAGVVRIGSQDVPEFLAAVLAETGPLDIVIDDGSHRMDHIPVSLEVLLPHVRAGGVYLIEDLHCAYWPSHGGGLEAEANFFNQLRRIIDDLHAPYHGGGQTLPLSDLVTGLHVYDSIAVLDRGRRAPPRHSMVGATQVARGPE